MSRHGKHGFSLVEVALALGLVAFSLVAIFSLLSVSFNGERAAKDDVVLAEIAGSMVDDLRNRSFSVASALVAGGTTHYFDADGLRVGVAAAMYQCTVSGVSDFPGAVSKEPNLLRVYFEFRWPVSNLQTGANERTIHTSLARYE